MVKRELTPISPPISLGSCFRFYNHERPHQALAYRTPAEVYTATANGSSKEG